MAYLDFRTWQQPDAPGGGATRTPAFPARVFPRLGRSVIALACSERPSRLGRLRSISA